MGGAEMKAPEAQAAKVKDPVCGMMIAKGDRHVDYGGQTHYFCADQCLTKFKTEPAKYVKAETAPTKDAC